MSTPPHHRSHKPPDHLRNRLLEKMMVLLPLLCIWTICRFFDVELWQRLPVCMHGPMCMVTLAGDRHERLAVTNRRHKVSNDCLLRLCVLVQKQQPIKGTALLGTRRTLGDCLAEGRRDGRRRSRGTRTGSMSHLFMYQALVFRPPGRVLKRTEVCMFQITNGEIRGSRRRWNCWKTREFRAR